MDTDTTPHDHDKTNTGSGSSRPPDPAVVDAAAGKATRESSSEAQRPHEPSQQQHNRGPPRDSSEAHLAGDVLLGAAKIAAHLTAILGEPVDADDVYYAHRMKKWPIGKYGALLIASRRRLNNHVEKITRGSSAA
jgi:hypothetical protein